MLLNKIYLKFMQYIHKSKRTKFNIHTCIILHHDISSISKKVYSMMKKRRKGIERERVGEEENKELEEEEKEQEEKEKGTKLM